MYILSAANKLQGEEIHFATLLRPSRLWRWVGRASLQMPQWLFTQFAGDRYPRSGGTNRLELVGILGDTPRDVLLVPLALRVR